MIQLRKTLQLAHSALDQAGIDHALIGGLALAHHGVHRATADIDLLVDGTKAKQSIQALENAGFKVEQTSPEAVRLTGPGYLDLLLANRPLSQKMLKEALKSDQLEVHVLRAEDIIGLKIQAYKNDSSRELQDKADIQSIARENRSLDLKRIQEYADLFGEWDTIRTLLQS